MFTDFFGLTGRPFQLTPDADMFVSTPTHRRALSYLSFGLAQAEGFVVVTGEVGAGKTTLVERLLRSRAAGNMLIASVVTSQFDDVELMSLIARQFRIPDSGASTGKSHLLSRIEQTLISARAEGKSAALIVDEAQNLSFSALEELRMLTNLVQDSSPLLQIILLGQPQFRRRLSSDPDLEQLRQRIVASHHLGPMSADEVQPYIEGRLNACGWRDDPVITDDAFEAIYEASDGVPRRINTICSRAFLAASLDEVHRIDGDLVRDVVDDLKSDNIESDGGARASADAGAPGSVEQKLERHDKVLRQLLGLVSDLSGDVERLVAERGE